jgi:hypothetical protein
MKKKLLTTAVKRTAGKRRNFRFALESLVPAVAYC